jgi:uncharacterized lipoprotein NlpE involved in copper resistance
MSDNTTHGQYVAMFIGLAFLGTNVFMNESFLLEVAAGWDQLTAVLVVTIGTAVALSLAISAWQQGRWILSLAFVAAWILGTSFSLSASLNRTASTLSAHNSQMQTKNLGSNTASEALADAKVFLSDIRVKMISECSTGRGPKCRSLENQVNTAQANIDQKRKSLVKAGANVVEDPAGEVLEALGIITKKNYALLQVLFLPLLLELGSVFLAYGFSNRRSALKVALDDLSNKEQFLADYHAARAKGSHPNVVELASKHGTSRATGYRWIKEAA